MAKVGHWWVCGSVQKGKTKPKMNTRIGEYDANGFSFFSLESDSGSTPIMPGRFFVVSEFKH